MMRVVHIARITMTAGLVAILCIAAVGHADLPHDTLTAKCRAALASAVGNPDPALPDRLMHALSGGQLVAALYNGTRLERLAALDAALSARAAPFELLPSLAALMGANDRQVASRAAHALHEILSGEAALPGGFAEVIPAQAAALVSQLAPLASDHRLDLDVRGVAILGMERLAPRATKGARPWLNTLINDREATIRRMALGMLTPPFGDQTLAALAGMAAGEPDSFIKGQAAAMLCENALYHGVKSPSEDLFKILKATVGDATMPPDALGAILTCIRRFEGTKQADLIDRALAHPDPAVKAFWQALSTSSTSGPTLSPVH